MPQNMLERNLEWQSYYTHNQQKTLMARIVHNEKEYLIMQQ